MKKRKILLLIPFAGLILSGCTFQDGISWIGQNIYTPVKDWITNLFNPGKKDEEKKDEEKGGEEGGGEEKPTEEQPEHAGTLADPFTGKDACIVAQKLEQGATTSERYYIQGEVQSIDSYNASYGNFTFFIEDGFECYRCLKGEAKAKYTSEDDLKVGDTVLVNAQLRKWYKTSETEDGYIAKINGVDQVSEETTEPEKINATLAEILATEGSKSQAYISTATIKYFANNTGGEVETPSEWGNMVLTDGEHDIFVYGSSAVGTDLAWDAVNSEYKFTNSKAFNTNELTKNLKKGDTINFWGIYFLYDGTTPEMNIIITSKEIVPVSSVSFGQIADPIEMELGKASAQVQLEAEVLPANASDKELVWTSGDESVATVVNGLVTAQSAGSTTITATAHDGSGKYATANVHVTQSEVTLESIEISVTGTVKNSYTKGEAFSSEGLAVIAHYSDSSSDSVTGSVTWSYEIGGVAVTEAAADHDGQTLKIIATLGSVSDDYDVAIEVASQTSVVYSISNPAGEVVAKKLTDLTDAQIMSGFVTESSQSVITSVSDYNAYVYFGGNGGTGDTAYNIYDCFKIGKSSNMGQVTLGLASNLNIIGLKLDVLGARDDGTLTINNETKNVTKKAVKGDLTPETIEFTFSSSPTSLVMSSKNSSSGNYGIFIVGMEFILG